MNIRPRSLLSNSLSSILSSAMLLFTTILVPALLVRTITKQDYGLYSTALAALPLLSIVPQSLRTLAGSELARAITLVDPRVAMWSYLIFTLKIGALVLVTSVAGVEIYHGLSVASPAQDTILRFGLYCVVGNVLGLIAIGLVTGPAAAYQNFLPDNFAKLWPVLFQMVSVALVWGVRPSHALWWLFFSYFMSTWTIAILMSLKLGPVFYASSGGSVARAPDKRVTSTMRRSLGGVVWWNLTSFLATSASIMIIAVAAPSHVAAFSVAISFLGISSAPLIAIASPVAVHAASIAAHGPGRRRRFFMMINSIFQSYILSAGIVVCLLPQWLFTLWLTPELAGEVRWLSLILLPSYVLRLLTMCFTIFVMSAGRQATLWMSPMVEAVLSVVGCVLLVSIMGVAGVAVALTFSAAVRLALTVMYDERLNRAALDLKPGDLLLSGWRLARAPRC